MQTWVRRIGSAIGMGLIWGFAGSMAGAVLARIPGFFSDLPFPLLFAPLGFMTGVLFSVILIAIESRRGFDRTSLPRIAVLGAASGLVLASIITAAAALRGDAVLSEFMLFGPPLILGGAVCSVASLAIARRAKGRDLPGPPPQLAGAGSTPSQELRRERETER